MPDVPSSTHVFLVVVPALFALAAIAAFLLGRRRGR